MHVVAAERVAGASSVSESFPGISHCFREANRPADRLANHGVDTKRDCLFHNFVELPSLVQG